MPETKKIQSKQTSKETILSQYQIASSNLVQEFVRQYYTDEEINEEEVDWYFIGTGYAPCVVEINEEFRNLDTVREAMKYNATREQLNTRQYNRPEKINFKNFIQYGKIPEYTKEDQEKDQNRIKETRKQLEDIILQNTKK